jgi:VanZ family protein
MAQPEQLPDDELEEPPLLRPGFFLHVVPAGLYVLAVFTAGSLGAAHLPGPELVTSDKLLHALAFAGMQLVLLRALRFQFPAWSFGRQNGLTFALASGLGALLELHQLALPHRSAEFLDWVADSMGAGLCAGILLLRERRRS